MGEKPENKDMVKHVLGKPNRWDRKRLEGAYEKVLDALNLIVSGEIDKAMNLYNTKIEK